MSKEKIRLQVLDIVETPIFNEQIDLTLGNATGLTTQLRLIFAVMTLII